MHNRKRSRHDFESSEIDPQNTVLVPGCESQLHEQNSKRLQNPLQRPLKRQPAYFDAHTLLSNLAFTNFAPTANFVEYERETSFVVLCLIDGKQGKEGGGHMYRSLWYVEFSIWFRLGMYRPCRPGCRPFSCAFREAESIIPAIFSPRCTRRARLCKLSR